MLIYLSNHFMGFLKEHGRFLLFQKILNLLGKLQAFGLIILRKLLLFIVRQNYL